MSRPRFKDIQNMARRPGRICPDYPNWMQVLCGCCAGLEWGGEEPRLCKNCQGSGTVFVHRNGTVAQWPGGPFNGDYRPEVWREH